MKVLRYINTPTLFCALWFVVAAIMFTVCVGEDFSLLAKRFSREEWPEERLRVPPALRSPLPSETQASHSNPGEPTLRELLDAPEETPVIHPLTIHGARYGVPPSENSPGSAEVVSTSSGAESFTVVLDLGQTPPEADVTFQRSPAAWFVDIPGTWRRKGPITYDFSSGTVRKLQVLMQGNRLRLAFYYRTRSAPQGEKPFVESDGHVLNVTVPAP